MGERKYTKKGDRFIFASHDPNGMAVGYGYAAGKPTAMTIDAADSDEPADYFDLARIHVKRKEFSAEIQAIDMLLAISEREDFSYETSSAKFLRAFALIETGQKREAMEDIQSLDSDMKFWVPGRGLMTVDQLKAAA